MPDANDAISAALEGWVASLEDGTEGQGPGVLGDWLAVVCMVDINSEGQPAAQYYLAMKGGAMLPHIAEGLLYRGIDELGSSTREE